MKKPPVLRVTKKQIQIMDIMQGQMNNISQIWFSTEENHREIQDIMGISLITLKQHLQRMHSIGLLNRPEGVKRGAYRLNTVRYMKLKGR